MAADPQIPAGASNAAGDRIRALSKAKRELEAELAALKAAGDPVALKAQVETMKEAARTQANAWATEKAIISAGVTDADGVETIRWAYERLPAEGRPELAAWLADREKLPKAAQAYLPAPAAVADPAAQPAAVAATPAAVVPPAGSRLPPNTPAAVPAPASAKLTQTQIAAVLASPEYKALDSTAKKARLAELQTASRTNSAPVV